jgi:alcohol dehydrogenase class IV
MAEYFFMPPMNITGAGALKSAGDEMVAEGYGKALIVTDEVLHRKVGATQALTDLLMKLGIEYAVYDRVTPILRLPKSRKALNYSNPKTVISSFLSVVAHPMTALKASASSSIMAAPFETMPG